MKHTALVSAFAIALSPALAHAGGDVVVAPAAPTGPVAVPAAAPAPSAPPLGPASTDGPYAALYGGASFLQDADNVGDPFLAGAGDVSVESGFDTGFAVGGALGYAISNPQWKVRYEADVAYRRHGLDELTIDNDGGLGNLLGLGSLNGLSTSDVDGNVNAISGMVNVWFDIAMSETVMPYVGGGLGAAHVSLDDISVVGEDLVDDSDTVFAWQLGAGVAWKFTPSIAATLDYRWFATVDPTFKIGPTRDEFESEYRTHNVMAGLRFGF